MSTDSDLDFLSLRSPSGPPTRFPFGEALAWREPLRLVSRIHRLRRAPVGDGRVVITVPGFGVSDGPAAPLRLYLRRLGYTSEGWGLGRNMGDPEGDAARMAPRIAAIADVHGPVTLVGWSLGGVVAREVARIAPEHVRSVVMYGSPVIGGPTHTILYRRFDESGLAEIAARQAELDRENPVTVPVTSIFSRRDSVVNWLACIDRYTPGARHVEVSASHMGLPLDPDVWLAVAEAIARD